MFNIDINFQISFCATSFFLEYTRMSEPVLLRVLASSVKIADRAGQIVRDIMAGGQLGKSFSIQI